jgi:SAM-dependent methyltransferase
MGPAVRRVEKTAPGEFVMRISAIEGYSLWAPQYDSELNPLIVLERRTMRDLLKDLPRSTILDVACGTGQWLSRFQQDGHSVFGCDASEEMLNEAHKISGLRFRLALADAECIPFRSSTADLIFCSLSIGYFQNLACVFAEFARALRPGGLLAISDVHPDAIAAGWTRSFKLDQQVYEINDQRRTLDEIDSIADHAGLKRNVSKSVYFDTPELAVFQSAGRAERFSAFKSIPALMIGTWEKPW